jgi:putative ABC transport system permease protein
MALGDVRSIQQIRRQSLSGATQPASLIGAFALLAVFLAALGLYGVLSHTVTQQRKEIGIRLALGAAPRNVVSHVLRNALSMLLVGLGLGLAGAFALTRLMKGLLFQSPALDPLVLTIGCLAMATIGLLAAFLPASRASRIDPINVLREDG